MGDRKNIISDLALLTTIPETSLSSLCDKLPYIICHDVKESIDNVEDVAEIDIGIGILYIKIDVNEIKYKFIPSRKLESMVTNTIKNNESPLTNYVDETLKKRILNTYKDLF